MYLTKRSDSLPENDIVDVFEHIWKGGYADVQNASGEMTQAFYQSYIDNYLIADAVNDAGISDEVDVFVEENGYIHPLEIKKSANPDKREVRKFDVIEKTTLMKGNGGIVCMMPRPFPIDKKNTFIPSNLI